MALVRWLRSQRTMVRVAIVLASIVVDRGAFTQAVSEYQLKAVFLYNFAQFVEWPPNNNRETPFVIGVLGDDPFGPALDETVRNEHVGARTFKVKRFNDVNEANDCQILFVSSSKENQLPTVLSALKGQPVLTVSDAPEFARRGGMIQFVNDDRRVKFLINVDAARAVDLTLSSKLLRSASIVSGERK